MIKLGGLILFASFSLLGADSVCHKSFRSVLETRSLHYFLDNAHPITGLVRDRVHNFQSGNNSYDYRMASIAATGFGLAIVANAAERRLLPRSVALAQVERTLQFAKQHLFRYRGWFHHFVDWETGERSGKSEVSTVDTAFFIAGALYAAQILQAPTITNLAHELYQDLDFIDMMTDG